MRRWTPILTVWSFAVAVCAAQENQLTVSTNAQLDPVRIRLVSLPVVPYTNSLLLDTHRSVRHVTFSSLTRRETQLGGAIAAVGDVNGDGFGDVLVAARRHQSGQMIRAGAVTLLAGSATGLVANTGWSFTGESINRQLGHALAGGKDVNGDHLPDMAVSTVRRMSADENRGGLNLFYGSRSAISDSRDWSYSPDELDSLLGDSLALADVNADGFADLLAGASRRTKTLAAEGAAFLFLGGKQGPGPAPSWSAFGGAAKGAFGSALTSPGDVNGDGFPDVLVGAPGFPIDGKPTGRVFLFTGGPSGLSLAPTWIADGPGTDSQFGISISGAGDVNGDGCADFVVGAPQFSASDPLPGTAYLFLGARQNMSTHPVWTASGEAPGARFGAAVAGVGDVDGDGLGDVLIGSPELTRTRSGARISGSAYLYLGIKGGLEAGPSWIVEGANAFRAGTVLAALGDLDGDGFQDFALGLSQRARVDVFYGAATGYHRGDKFPTDGISAKDAQPASNSASPPSLAGGSAQVQNSISRAAVFFGLAAVLVLITAIILLMRKRQRAATNSERARIAKDLHDDLGARLTRLSLLMDPANRQTTDPSTAKANDETIARTAREILTSMDEVIWSENPESDTLENLVTFIFQYASPFFAPTPVRCQCDAPTNLPKRKISADARKNIFLAVKEALNNIAKHAEATEVQIQIRFTEPLLTIIIRDNGRGYASPTDDNQNATRARTTGRGGNGLLNMRQRMAAIGGSFEISSTPDTGTRVTLQARL